MKWTNTNREEVYTKQGQKPRLERDGDCLLTCPAHVCHGSNPQKVAPLKRLKKRRQVPRGYKVSPDQICAPSYIFTTGLTCAFLEVVGQWRTSVLSQTHHVTGKRMISLGMDLSGGVLHLWWGAMFVRHNLDITLYVCDHQTVERRRVKQLRSGVHLDTGCACLNWHGASLSNTGGLLGVFTIALQCLMWHLTCILTKKAVAEVFAHRWGKRIAERYTTQRGMFSASPIPITPYL